MDEDLILAMHVKSAIAQVELSLSKLSPSEDVVECKAEGLIQAALLALQEAKSLLGEEV